MANYVFESTTQAQANNFTSADFLVFITTSTSAINISVSPTLSGDAIILSAGNQTLTFSAVQLSTAANNNQLIFNDGSSLKLGTGAGETITGTNGVDVAYGFDGADTISGANGGDYIYGGGGADSLDGGNGNDHIYGNSLNTTQGAADGNDSILGGNGADYVNGNAGNDTIDGEAGSDRLFGGNGDDSIRGSDGNDTINGNLGNDSIDGGNDNDFIRGGQGDDTILGGNGDDIIVGDLGNDSLVGGNGYDVFTGGAGNDTFNFAGATDAAFTTTGASAFVTDLITDFQDSTDKIALGFTVDVVRYAQTGVSFAQGALASAITYAQERLDTDTAGANTPVNDVVSLNVGTDVYLFYRAGGTAGAIDSIIRVNGITDAASINVGTNNDFV